MKFSQRQLEFIGFQVAKILLPFKDSDNSKRAMFLLDFSAELCCSNLWSEIFDTQAALNTGMLNYDVERKILGLP